MVPIEVLHVGDSEVTEATAEALEDVNTRFDVETVHTQTAALDRIEGPGGEPAVDCVVSGYEINGGNGLDLLESVREPYPDLPFVLFTDAGSEEIASRAISRGVTDYLARGAETDQHELLAKRVETAVEQSRARARLERLHEVTRQFMREQSSDAICETAVEAVEDVLDFQLGAAWLVRDEQSDGEPELRPVAASERSRDLFDELPTYAPGNSLSWEAFESGEAVFYRDVDEQSDAYDPDTPVQSELILPLGDQGVLNVGSTRRRDIRDLDRSLANLLAANAEAALDRAAREEARARSERELERQNERLEEFVSVVAHDLQNPLNVAEGRLEVAADECDSEFLDGVAAAHDRMERLIEDLLAFAREGETVEDTRPLFLPAMVEDARESADTAGVEIVVETDATVRAEPERLRRLLENLFRNAAEHGVPGQPSPNQPSNTAGGDEQAPDRHVTITVGDLEGGFFVADDGVGVPPEKCDRVFESGYTTSRDGTGFGLSIVKQIADAHDWEVDLVESAAGGARFEFTGVGTVP